jgi:hypothetical protein
MREPNMRKNKNSSTANLKGQEMGSQTRREDVEKMPSFSTASSQQRD